MDGGLAETLVGAMLGGGGDGIRDMMNAATGVCKCVRMNPDGSTEEIDLDMTPSQRKVHEALGGGEVTFLGQWEPLGVFLVARRDADEETETFQGTLPKPFDACKGEFQGAVVMTRTLECGKPADFTLAEFQEFAAKKPEPWQEMPIEEEEEEPLETIEEGDEDSDSSSDGGEFEAESSSDDDGADDEFEEMMMEKLVADFTRENGRAPTMEESVGLRSALQEKLGSKESSDDDEDEEEEEENNGEVRAAFLQSCLTKFAKEHGRDPSDEERAGIEKTVDAKLEASDGEALVVEKVVAHFTAHHGRAPSAAEVEEVLEKLAAAEEAAPEEAAEEAAATPEEAAADSKKRPREEEAAAEEDGEEPGILEQLMALFKENHGRDPTEAEVQQWRDTLREAAEEADAGVVAAAPKEDNTPRGKAPEPVAQVSVEPAAKKQRVAEA
ncbi:unnamed protein product [Pelagomonas calceolata]|uniref:DUF5880 domain-containing protein n=1 Tax=Pelagomonas calceolata TaxID=35677 RepID=A0A6S8UKM5_9STRA|nr:unnamed protein product [Pelagomonas calceolata]|mmetsp:Transcript_21999/g.67522  ORF Transcript_21999/g.67522 Transcript_21999/m.67522 type:complete len:441 (+) Transcript_21999:71-1393(+)